MVSKAALDLRAKIIGVLLRDARQNASKSTRECAELLGVSTAAYRAYEAGRKTPSLPELEILAYALEVPVNHFWGNQVISERAPQDTPDYEEVISLRQRIVGAQLRQGRIQADLSMKELARKTGIPASRISAYEFGKRPIPLPELEALAGEFGLAVDHFLGQRGPIVERDRDRRLMRQVSELPDDLREFISIPVHESYLRLAMQLSKMPVTRLRAIAEGLLDITL